LKKLKSYYLGHAPFIIFFIGFLILGLFIYRDYGVSWDEPISREACGRINYNYITTGDYKTLIEGNEKYHGPAFEIFLYWLENFLKIYDTQHVYYMRHLVTFLFFALSIVLFYKIVFDYNGSTLYATLACIFLVISPRIFAESFYNSKDIALLSAMIACIYTYIRYLRKAGIINIFLHALSSAILIDIRITGIIIPLFTLIFPLLNSFLNGQFKKILFKTILYLLFLCPLVILFWPVLWQDPLHRFIDAFMEMKKYHWNGSMLFNGYFMEANNIKWQYTPVWIGISTPILYWLSFIIGMLFFILKVIHTVKLNWKEIFKFQYEWLHLYIIVIPILSVIILHSVIYDGWRHLYFIYPSMIFFSIYAIKKLFEKFNLTIFKYALALIIACSVVSTSYSMISLHPYENVYFNFLAGKSLREAKLKYEFDYWGLSFREGLQYILDNDTNSIIKVYADVYPGEQNAMLIDDKDRERLVFTDSDISDYFVTAYRSHPKDDFPYKEYFSVVRDSARLMSVFDMHNPKRKENILFQVQNNFSNNDINLLSVKLDTDKVTNNVFNKVLSDVEFTPTYVYNTDSTFSNSDKVIVKFSANLYSQKSFKFSFVAQIDSSGKSISWQDKQKWYSSVNQWKKINAIIKLPRVTTNETLRFYLLNFYHTEFYLDDFNITVINLSE
jgi:hypothetical protein